MPLANVNKDGAVFVAAVHPVLWLRAVLCAALILFVPVAWISMLHDPYAVDGDAVAYMDIADLIRTHQWAGVVNAYWHPLYPAMLVIGQWMFHPSRATELAAYYRSNFFLFVLEAAAVLAFTTALCRLRDGLAEASPREAPGSVSKYLLPTDGVRLLGVALLVIASQRELTLGKVRPDALLQALLLFACSAMLTLCRPLREAPISTQTVGPKTIEPLWQYAAAALMGIALGFAYLTKSFALVVACLSLAAMVAVQSLVLKRRLAKLLPLALVTCLCFAAIAGPYVAALSLQKHRLDFGDSGSLNYAWYVAQTEKFHLEPWQMGRFGSSTVHLLHPERQVLASPGVYSYKALPWGTLPVWFDPSYFNERIVTHVRPGQLVRRDARNAVLTGRYLLNHPEAWLLLGLLLLLGTKWGQGAGMAAQRALWLPAVLGLAIWCIYGLVNVEERYVTVAYLLLVLPAFAALRTSSKRVEEGTGARSGNGLSLAANACIALLCVLALGESLRTALELRRLQSVRGLAYGWQDSPMFAVAEGMKKFHLVPGTEIACVGTIACLYDPYWMRLAQVRTTTEIFMDHDHVAESMAALPNRSSVYDAIRAEGAPVLVGHFDPATLLTGPLAGEGWQRLGHTDFFALPLRQAGRVEQPAFKPSAPHAGQAGAQP